MDMKGSYDIAAPREAVWNALNDVEVLKACIPGCETITKHSDTELEATVSAKVGPVKAKFTGAVTLSDMDPPNGYTISGQGKGGAAGFAKGGAHVSLVEIDTGTQLSYVVNANVGGKLAQIGSRLIDSTAKKMADQFFSKLSEEAAAKAAALDPAPAPAAAKISAPISAHVTPDAATPDAARAVSPVHAAQKPDPLNTFKPITFEIWLTTVIGLFAFLSLWLILG
ncbi:MAG: carbon monoxide dehydrogenase subunit G [Rhodospirillaceae bacterium]